jgi:DNA-binding NarL/FixJ family response regulator
MSSMGRTRRTYAAGHESGRQSGSRRVVVCAADLTAASRIRHALIAGGHEVVGTCLSLLELTEDLSLIEADLAVAMVNPARDAAQLGLLRRRHPALHLIAVVSTVGGAQSGRLLAADIDGLVLEDELEHVLDPAIASVADQLCVPSGALPVLAGPVFSHREKQVLKLLVAGLTNSEIAGRLYLSESTVKSHLSSSFRKLGVSSRAEVVRRARTAEGPFRLPLTPDRAANPPAVLA